MDDRVQSVERSLDILMCVAEGQQTLTEIARATNLSKATASRLLGSLAHRQMVVKDPLSKEYLLGAGCLRLFQSATHGLGWVASLAKPYLLELRERTGETVTIHVRTGHDRVCVEELPSPHPIRYTSALGASAPIHVGSAGKILLSALSPDELERLLDTLPLQKLTPMTITDRARLKQEIDAIQERGWATSSGERIPGAAAVSVLIRGPHKMRASLSLLGPSDRLTFAKGMDYLGDLQDAAAHIESALMVTDGKLHAMAR